MRRKCKGDVECLYVKALLEFLRLEAGIELETDSSAARGTSHRLGAGKRMRHLEVIKFYLQELAKMGLIDIKKVAGTNQIADLGTKYLGWPVMERLLKRLDVKLMTFGGKLILGAVFLPTGEAARSEELMLATRFLVDITEQIDMLLYGLRWRVCLLLMLIIAGRLVWLICEKVAVEIATDKAKAFLG